MKLTISFLNFNRKMKTMLTIVDEVLIEFKARLSRSYLQGNTYFPVTISKEIITPWSHLFAGKQVLH